MQLVSMNIKDDDTMPLADYDCSPCIYLTEDQVEALGITGMPAPGTVFMLQAHAVVTSVTARAEESDEVAKEGNAPDVSLSLKLTDMGVSRSGKDNASILYGA